MVTTKTYTFSDISANHTISAEFEIMTYAIHFAGISSSDGLLYYKVGTGSWTLVEPGLGTTVNIAHGATLQVKVEDVVVGKAFDRFSYIDENDTPIDMSTDNPATFTISAAGDITTRLVSVTTYTITATAGTHGSISPSGTITLNAGSTQTFTVTADANYVISQILVDGSPIQL